MLLAIASPFVLPSPPVLQGGEGSGVRGRSVRAEEECSAWDTEPPHPNPLPLSTGGEGAGNMVPHRRKEGEHEAHHRGHSSVPSRTAAADSPARRPDADLRQRSP